MQLLPLRLVSNPQAAAPQDLDFFGCDAPGVDRFHFDAKIPQEDLAEYYLAVFEAPIKSAKPASIMCR